VNDKKRFFTKYIRQKLSFEDLLRKRRISDHARYVETFRRNIVDPNPHQIQAVAFAIDRLENSGGAILCDEVGLGKTIETGLVLTQLRAEGKNHILILVPISLSRQWQVEMQDLFGIKSVVLGKENLDTHQDPGIYIAGREFAGNKNRASHFKNWGPWDLIVVDEAHEVLGSIYQRFNCKTGEYNDDLTKGKATRAGWLKTILDESPSLLLTATPLQNNMLELWSLVHFADKSGAALGDFAQFSAIFTEDRGRSIQPENASELRERLQAVIYRTLRTQAQPFLKQRFTARSCETIDFRLRPEERLLYEELGVIDYNSSSENKGEFLTLSTDSTSMFSSINKPIGENKCYRQELMPEG
jgi:SNF2 family DNA or RNA helicase